MQKTLTSFGNDVSWFLSQLKLESRFNLPILRGKLWSNKRTQKQELRKQQVPFWFRL